VKKTLMIIIILCAAVMARNGAAPEPKPKLENWISFGVGGVFTSDFGGGVRWPGAQTAMPNLGGGGYVYIDAVYAEFFAGYVWTAGRWESGAASGRDNLPDMRRSNLNIGALAKYPFEAGGARLFPLLGIEYEASASGGLKYDDGYEYPFDGKFEGNSGPIDANTLRSLWYKFGGGVDVGLGREAYFRAELLYGIRTASAFEKDCRVLYRENVAKHDMKTRLGHGLTLKAGFGANF